MHLIVGGLKMNPTSNNSSSCTLLIDLPSEIIINILAKLPIRTIISCKCVCKELLSILSTPEFVAYHLSLSTSGLVVRQLGSHCHDTCRIFEFEDKFDLQHHNLHDHAVMKFNPSLSTGFFGCKLRIKGSVNGILCLLGEGIHEYDALFLCNPITREYIALPMIEGIHGYPYDSEFGFGVSRISGHYKVVGNVYRNSRNYQAAAPSTFHYYECLVYTVGTRSWRNVKPGKPLGYYHTSFSLFLNGNLHGLKSCGNSRVALLISCFDLETESFVPFPPLPPPAQDSTPFGTLGILDDCLCFVYNSSRDSISLVIWLMKEYGVKESWTKQLVIAGSQDLFGKFYNIYPVKAFKDGDILFNYNTEMLFYFCNKTKTCEDFDFLIRDGDGFTEAIPHKSSFLSLKSLDCENVELFRYDRSMAYVL